MFPSEPLQCCAVRIAQRPQIRRVHLRMAVELSEITVHEAAIEEERECLGQVSSYALATCMKDVEMVLEAD